MHKLKWSALAVANLVATGAMAQDPSEDVFHLGTLVLNAQYHEQLAKDVPISTSAVTEAELNAQRIDRVTNALDRIPNVLTAPTRGGKEATSITIRGVGTTAYGADPSVSVYVDDVYIGSDGGFSASLPDLKFVEVLRGPQGTLSGRNALAGSVRLSTGEPELGVNETEVELGYATANEISAGLTTNLALSQDVALRFSLLRETSDGRVENQQGGDDIDAEDSITGRLKLLYAPSANWTSTLTFDYARDESLNALGPIDTVFDQGVNSAQPFEETVENGGVSWKNTVQLDFAELTSITAWRMSENELAPGNLTPTILDLRLGSRDYEQLTQEFRLTGSTERLNWTLGAFVLKSDDRREEGTELAVPVLSLPAGYRETSDSDTETTSVALFADARYALSDQLEVLGGLRASYDRKEIEYSHDNNVGLPLTLFALRQTVDDKVTTRHIAPRLGLNWAANPDTNVYAMISSGYKPAGFNIASAGTPDLRYDKETAVNYEVGVKGALLDGAVNYAFAAFYLDWKDQQVFDFENGVLSIDNADKSVSKGAEFQADAVVSDTTVLKFGLGYTKAEFVDYINSLGGDASGNTQPLTSEYTASLGIEHAHALRSNLDLILRGNYTWRSSFYFDADNLIKQPAYGLLDLSASLEANDWTAMLYVNNALDEDYLAAAGNIGGILGFPGEGRSIGVSLSKTF